MRKVLIAKLGASGVVLWIVAWGLWELFKDAIFGWLNSLLVERWGVIETTIQQAFPTLTTIVPPVVLGLVAIGVVWGVYKIGRGERQYSGNKRSQAIAPELIEEVQTLYNAWLKPAGDAANDVIRRVLFALRDHADASVRSHEGLIQRSIIDVERAALSKLNNVLTGTEPISEFDQLQDCIINYYREYQCTRTWIAKGGELGGFLFHNDSVCQAWLHLDEKFLDVLRDFAGPPRYERLRNGIKSVGWGENVTRDLKRLAGSNSPDARDNGNGTR